MTGNTHTHTVWTPEKQSQAVFSMQQAFRQRPGDSFRACYLTRRTTWWLQNLRQQLLQNTHLGQKRFQQGEAKPRVIYIHVFYKHVSYCHSHLHTLAVFPIESRGWQNLQGTNFGGRVQSCWGFSKTKRVIDSEVIFWKTGHVLRAAFWICMVNNVMGDFWKKVLVVLSCFVF